MIEFLKLLDRQTSKPFPFEYTPMAIAASREEYVILDIVEGEIVATLTDEGEELLTREITYPTLVEANGVIVLASSPTCGTVLVSNDPTMPMGLFRMNWEDFRTWTQLETGDVVTLTQH